MPNLEHLHLADPPRETPLDRQPGVGLEQKPRAPVAHHQHHAVLVHVEREREPQAVRAQHLERHAVELDPVAATRRMPAGPSGLDRGQELEIERTAERLPRLEHERRVERVHHRRQPAQVVRVAVRRDRERQPPGSVTPQERDHHAPAGVALGSAGAAVDHDPAPGRRPQHGGVALPYIQKMYRQTTAFVE